MKTKRGIYLKLNESEYKFSFKGLTFYFSSKKYLQKFVENLTNYIDFETEKFKVKYGININFDTLFMISLYKKIEKRGFRIYDNINKKEILENVKFSLNFIK